MKVKTALLLASAILLAIPAESRAPSVLSGQVAHDRITYLTGTIPWYTSLGQAEESARHQGKLIFWMQMLGSITGGT
jgi:hypothetical protein